ncbi:MAG: helix-turn-helix transcriptional regulator [Alphaproteobacteria bacterium]
MSVGTAVLLVDDQGRPLFGNREALAKMPADPYRQEPDRELLHQEVRSLVTAAVAAANAGGVQCATAPALSKRERPQPLGVVVCPMQPLGSGASGGTAALVIAAPCDRWTAFPPEDLAQPYCLTRAEAELLAALIAGETLGDYCERAGIGMNTAKTHLRQIFAKTHTNRQIDAVRIVLTNPLMRLRQLFG